MPNRKLRIRHCGGNKDAWLLVALSDDGTESDSFGSYVTALSLDGLLKVGAHLLYDGVQIELIPA